VPAERRTLHDDARACWAAALAAVEPGRIVRTWLARDGASLVLRRPLGEELARHAGPVLVVAVGKAAAAMAGAACDVAGVDGWAIVPQAAVPGRAGRVTVAGASHPIPDAAGVAATAELLGRVRQASAETLVVALVSGGASALMVAPGDGITLADKQAVTRALLRAGADIGALNTVRKHLSRVKGGGLARAAQRAAGLWTLVLSDVIGDDLATIASGPSVADPTTFADAGAALDRYVPAGEQPAAVRARLAAGRAGQVPETVKPGDPVLARVRTEVLAGNRTAVAAAAAEARRRGYRTAVVGEPLAGDAATAGRALAARLLAEPGDGPVAVVAGGETTVEVVGVGLGGRSQHLALAAALVLAGHPGAVLAAGTDGVDGPTDAAGALVDGDTAAALRRAGIDPEATLRATDSHHALDAVGALVRTGPTGTNVADLALALRGAG
jgi:glycerate-2-kinase